MPGSDADLLILLAHPDQRRVDRPLRFAGYFDDVGLPVDPVANAEARHVLGGVTLCDDPYAAARGAHLVLVLTALSARDSPIGEWGGVSLETTAAPFGR